MMDCASFDVICCKCIPFSIAMACASWQQKKKTIDNQDIPSFKKNGLCTTAI